MSMRSSKMRNRQRGVTTMEMVIICVLVSAVTLVAIIALGRAIFRDTDVMEKAVVGDAGTATEAVSCPKKGYKVQATDDIDQAQKFAKEMSKVKSSTTKQ
ncbi:MAG: hypothetical protein IJR99_12980 [Kiritimatiellae bacterium]|nr:hypothetical protein [Kiritimatiellia bacterium]